MSFQGRSLRLGKSVKTFRIGQYVTALPVIGCGNCEYCFSGDVAHCKVADYIGVLGSPGAFAEYVRVSAREAFVLPEEISLSEGALIEPLAVAHHALESKMKPGDDILVMGAGPIGLAVVIWARNLGASKITVSDPVTQRRDLAGKLGADRIVDPKTEEITGPYNVIIECVGHPGMLGKAIDSMVPHGRIVMLGACREPDVYVPFYATIKEVSLLFSIYYQRQDFGSTLHMMKAGRIDAKPLISEVISLGALPEMFQCLKHGMTNQCKVLVEP